MTRMKNAILLHGRSSTPSFSPMKEISTEEAFDRFKPESCVFVISADRTGKPNGIAGWNMKCSSDPAMLAVALWNGGNTHRLIRESKEFVVAVPNKRLQREVEYFGSTHGNTVDKFAETKLATEKSKFIVSPLIKDATINFECRYEKEIEVGDHIIFIGRVLASYHNPGKKVLLNMRKVAGKRVFEEF